MVLWHGGHRGPAGKEDRTARRYLGRDPAADPAAGGAVYPINPCKHRRVLLTCSVDVYIRMRLHMHIYKGYVYAHIYIYKGYMCVFISM